MFRIVLPFPKIVATVLLFFKN